MMLTRKRQAGGAPSALERANAFAFRGRGRLGRGRGGNETGQAHSGRGTAATGGHWAREGANTPEPELKSTSPAYTANTSTPPGTKKGYCNNCGKYGHFAYECKDEEGSAKSPQGPKGIQPRKGK